MLDGGLRLVHLLTPRANVAHFGVAVRAGSGNELKPDEFGLAHFVEHTLFKGTLKRNSWHIINRMEAVGGELNAFTTKVDTVVYATFPKGSLRRAVDLISDLIVNSQFPTSELSKERQVICDEINSYLDSPADAVYDEFEDLLYAGTPLGHNILGTIESVMAIDSEKCRRWLHDHYRPDNMVAFYAGPAGFDVVVKVLTPYIALLPPQSAKSAENGVVSDIIAAKTFDMTRNIDSHQAHTVMGCALTGLSLAERTALSLLTNILGGPGMNSLFNVSLREKRGLVYNVESAVANWGESGIMFTTYFGTDPADNDMCIKLVRNEIERLAEGLLSPRRLAAAKKQYRGQMIVARDNPESHIQSLARAILSRGQALTTAETDALIAAVTADDLRDMARRIMPLSRLTLSPRI